MPAWQLSRTDMWQVPRFAMLGIGAAWAAAPHIPRVRRNALATVLVISRGAARAQLRRARAGADRLDASRVLTIRASAPDDRYVDPGQITAVFDAMTQRLRWPASIASARFSCRRSRPITGIPAWSSMACLSPSSINRTSTGGS